MSESPDFSPKVAQGPRRFPVLSANPKRVRELRHARKLTQLQLAIAADVSERTVRSAETGKRVRMDSLEQIATAMGVTLLDLVADSNELHSANLTNSQVDQLLLGVRTYVASLDISEIARVLSPTTLINIVGPKEIPFTGEFVGTDGLNRIRDLAEMTMTFIEPTEVTEIHASGNLVVIRGFDCLRSVKTGDSERLWWHHVYEFHEGRVTRLVETFDTHGAYQILCGPKVNRNINGEDSNDFTQP